MNRGLLVQSYFAMMRLIVQIAGTGLMPRRSFILNGYGANLSHLLFHQFLANKKNLLLGLRL